MTHWLIELHVQAKKDVAGKPSSSSGGKKAKKKWSAKKVKDKSNNLVILDKPTYDRLFKEVPTYKLISQSVLVDRLKLNGSLARIAIRELEAQGLIKPISRHHAQVIYSKYTLSTFLNFLDANILIKQPVLLVMISLSSPSKKYFIKTKTMYILK